jgi:hypothetical protein
MILVRCGIVNNRIIGSYFINRAQTVQEYADIPPNLLKGIATSVRLLLLWVHDILLTQCNTDPQPRLIPTFLYYTPVIPFQHPYWFCIGERVLMQRRNRCFVTVNC